jgi:hypothetical protein
MQSVGIALQVGIVVTVHALCVELVDGDATRFA